MATIKRKTLLGMLVVLSLTIFMSTAALAVEAGWSRKGKNVSYYTVTDGESKAVTGLQKIGNYTYYFNSSGVLQKGWVKTAEGIRYFRTSGGNGTVGRMYVGLKTIKKKKFYFDPETGLLATGMTTVGSKTYFFSTSKKLGTRGGALTNKFVTRSGKKYYFNSKGYMVKNCWVKVKGKRYYLQADGTLLTNGVTAAGWLVDAKGVRVKKVSGWFKYDGKYKYFSKAEKKVLSSQWLTVSGKKYYLNENGYRVTGKQTIEGVVCTFDAEGVLQSKEEPASTATTTSASETGKSGKKRVLIIAGHGQGDSGATSVLGQEYLYTRQFAKLIYDNLKAAGKVDVEYYKNGSTSYDLYKQNAATYKGYGLTGLNGVPDSSTVKKLKAGMDRNSNLPRMDEYDFVLEVHFNATAASAKDPGGDGSYKGLGFYINNNKKKWPVESKVLSAIRSLGFKIWGGGVFSSSTLYNPKIFTELGVDYTLLETAFIDDKDDMTFYNKNKKSMAKAVSNAILAVYG